MLIVYCTTLQCRQCERCKRGLRYIILTKCYVDFVEHCSVNHANDVNKVIKGMWCRHDVYSISYALQCRLFEVLGTRCWHDDDSILVNIDKQCYHSFKSTPIIITMSTMSTIAMKHSSLDLPRPLAPLSLWEFYKDFEDFEGLVDNFTSPSHSYSLCEYITKIV